MKKIFNKLAVLLGMLAGLGFLFSACAVSGSGVSDDEVKVPSAGDSGSKTQLTDAQIVEKFPNQYMFRYNGKSDDQFSETAPYSITDFGKDDTNGVFRYYPTPVDLTSDTGEFSAVVNGNNISGKQGIGFVQIQDNKVIGWWLVTTGNKIRYLNPKNTVSSSKTTENGSGWDTTTLTDGKFAKDTNYTVKIALKGSITSTSSADNGQRGFEVDVFDAAGTKVANKAVRYPVWMTPDSDSKIYFAIGTMGNDSAYTTWSNVTVKINNGETYTMKKIVNTQDQSSMTVKDESGNAVKSVLVSAGKTVTYKYSAKDKAGSDVEPKVTVTPEGFATVTVDKNAKTISIAAGSSEGTGKVTVVNELGTGKPSVEIAVEVAVSGTVKLNGNVVADLETAFAGLDATTGGNITLTAGTFIVPDGKQLTYAGNGAVTITGEGTAEYGSDVKIVGNPNTGKQGERELIYFTGNSEVSLKNLTVVNKFVLSTDCQAEALASNGAKSRIIANNCTFDSHQDTIRTTGKAWFYKCHIKGDVDFIWMEKSGTVALYENCKLTCVADRKNAAYIVAPRSTYTTDGTIGKGIVVLDSSIVVENFTITKPAEEGAFLFRNPWYKDTVTTAAAGGCYNNAAFINTTVTSGTLNSVLVAKPGFGIGDNSVVGWKTDGTTGFTATNVGTISAADLTAEYHNRGFILNKLIKINGTNTSYVVDEDDNWDVKGKIAEAETAKATVNPTVSAFDATNATVIWDLTGDWAGVKKADSSSVTKIEGFDGYITGTVSKDTGKTQTVKMYVEAASGKLSPNSGKSQFNAGTVLTIPVTNGAEVTAEFHDSNYAKVSKIESVSAAEGASSIKYTHSGAATGVIIYAIDASYIKTVTVKGINLSTLTDDLKNATATGTTRAVKITSSVGEINSGASSTFVAKAYTSYGASPATITWEKTDTDNVLSSVEGGTVQAASVTSDKTATVIAKVSDTIKDSKTVTIKAVGMNAFTIKYIDSEAHSAKSNLVSTNSNGNVAIGGTGTASTLTVNASGPVTKDWYYKSDAVKSGTGCLVASFITGASANSVSGYNTFYIDFPVEAKVACTIKSVSLGGVNYGTGNVKSAIYYKKSTDSDFTKVGEDIATRNITSELKTDCSIGLAANETVIIRIAAGNTVSKTDNNKTWYPGVGTVTITGE